MYHVSMELAEVDNSERHNEDPNDKSWKPFLMAQARTKDQAKAMVLDSVLEALNSEDLLPSSQWVRLVYRKGTKLNDIEVEVF